MKKVPWHLVVGIGAILVASVLVASATRGSDPDMETSSVYVPMEDIYPYVLITKDMLKQVTESSLPPEDAGRKNPIGTAIADLIGRYGLTRLPAGRGISADQLGPSLAPEALANRRIATATISVETILDALQRGKGVTVLLSPTDVSKEPLVLPNTLLLDWKKESDGKMTAVLAISSESVTDWARYIGGSTVTLVR